MLPAVFCGAVQELCEYLTLMVESGDQFDLKMLDVVKRDPVVPASEERASSLTPKSEEPTSVPTPSEPIPLEPDEAVQPEELTLVAKTKAPTTPWVYPFVADMPGTPPLEDADQPMSIPLGSQQDLTSLGSLEWTVSHYPAMG